MIEVMSTVPRAVSVDNVIQAGRDYIAWIQNHAPSPEPLHELALANAMAYEVLDRILGRSWMHRHIKRFESIAPPRGYPDPAGEHLRVAYLADSLFNLQGIDGFAERVRAEWAHSDAEQLATEVTCARIHVRAGRAIRLVVPGQPDSTHDIDVLHDAAVVASSEIKGKLSVTDFSEATCLRAMKRGAAQTPRDRAGFVWLHVPPTWTQLDRDAHGPLARTAAVALRDYPHLAAVLVASETVAIDPDVEAVRGTLLGVFESERCRLMTETVRAILEQLRRRPFPPPTGWVDLMALARELVGST
jgi:hypothetical protein